jgi:hypothetical protein
MLYYIHLRLYIMADALEGKARIGEKPHFHKVRFPIPEDGTDYPPDKRSDSIQIDALKARRNPAMYDLY